MGKSAFLNIGNPDGSLTGTSTPHRQVVHTTLVCDFCRLLWRSHDGKLLK